MTGAPNPKITPPRWLLAELSYQCPLQCPYCSNPLDYADAGKEISTASWKTVLSQARKMGAVQLGFSGGEPLTRQDLPELVQHAKTLGYYSNLITSGYGLTADKIATLKKCGLDHIQLSMQASDRQMNDYIAGTASFDEKIKVARLIKEYDYPMVLCVVLHRQNIGQIQQILQMAQDLNADYVELANTQYYGWAHHNRDLLMPSLAQYNEAEKVVNEWRQSHDDKMTLYYVVADFYGDRPKPCMNGWGSTFLTIAPDGVALPCHSARQLPGLDCPSVEDFSIEDIWHKSKAFNFFRGDDWMQEPCKSCPEKTKDFGGCRCQAYLLTGDMYSTDPVCSKSPKHFVVEDAIAAAQNCTDSEQPLVFRNSKNSKKYRV